MVSAVLLGLAVLLVAPRLIAGEHLRSQVHPALWYYWPQRWVEFYVQDTRGAPLNVGPGGPITSDDMVEASSRAFAAWSSNTCTDMQFYYQGIVASRDSNMVSDSVNHMNTIIFRYDDWDQTECQDAIACTTVVTRRAAGEIIDADIDLNLQEHEFVLQPIEGSTAFDLQSVLTHEVGHMLGFDHTQPSHPEAVMWPYASWGDEATRRELAADDVNTLCDTYPVGACPVVNDYGQSACPQSELAGGCACASAGEPNPPQQPWQGGFAGVVGLAVAILVGRKSRVQATRSS